MINTKSHYKKHNYFGKKNFYMQNKNVSFSDLVYGNPSQF